MESLKNIKRRIASVKGTTKVTGTMKMVAASKLKKIQGRVVGARNYAQGLKNLALEAAHKGGELKDPTFLLRNKTEKVIVFAITAEKGFCGGLCERLIRQTKQFITLMKDRDIETSVWVAGEKGVKCFKKSGIDCEVVDLEICVDPDKTKISHICRELLGLFLSGQCDQVLLAYNTFRAAAERVVTIDLFLPIWVKDSNQPKMIDKVDFIYEPSKEEIFKILIKESLESLLWRAVFESHASELAARVMAMDEAQKNAKDMILNLSRKYNRLRQTSITHDLMDIIGGAEALNAR